MKLNSASLAIGIGIGIAVAIAAIVVFVMQPGRVILDNEIAMAAVVSSNNMQFWMSGLITEISDDKMTIDQTFRNPQYTNRQDVKVRLDHAGFVSCRASDVLFDETCEDSVVRKVGEKQVVVCALTSLYNGEFYAGKVWADAACGP